MLSVRGVDQKEQGDEHGLGENPWGGGTPLYELYRYVRPQRVWFSGVLVINRVSI